MDWQLHGFGSDSNFGILASFPQPPWTWRLKKWGGHPGVEEFQILQLYHGERVAWGIQGFGMWISGCLGHHQQHFFANTYSQGVDRSYENTGCV